MSVDVVIPVEGVGRAGQLSSGKNFFLIMLPQGPTGYCQIEKVTQNRRPRCETHSRNPIKSDPLPLTSPLNHG